MKRILLACFLLAATCTAPFVTHSIAQAPVAPPVTQATFTAKVNLMDTYIGAGDMTSAQATWTDVHTMMLHVLATSKTSIRDAATPADKDAHMTILQNQTTIYRAVWALKTDLATNRVAIHNKLGEFNLTIY